MRFWKVECQEVVNLPSLSKILKSESAWTKYTSKQGVADFKGVY